MNNKENNNPPKRGRGPVFEKPKNFKEAIKRLFKELKVFKTLIIVSLLLASLGSVLSIVSPDRLKDLTNEIS